MIHFDFVALWTTFKTFFFQRGFNCIIKHLIEAKHVFDATSGCNIVMPTRILVTIAIVVYEPNYQLVNWKYTNGSLKRWFSLVFHSEEQKEVNNIRIFRENME